MHPSPTPAARLIHRLDALLTECHTFGDFFAATASDLTALHAAALAARAPPQRDAPRPWSSRRLAAAPQPPPAVPRGGEGYPAPHFGGVRGGGQGVWNNGMEGDGNATEACGGRDGGGHNFDPPSDFQHSRNSLVREPYIKQEEDGVIILSSGDERDKGRKRTEGVAMSQHGDARHPPPRPARRSAPETRAKSETPFGPRGFRRTAAANGPTSPTRATQASAAPPTEPPAVRTLATSSPPVGEASGELPKTGLKNRLYIWTQEEKDLMPDLMMRFRDDRRRNILISEALGSKTPLQVQSFRSRYGVRKRLGKYILFLKK